MTRSRIVHWLLCFALLFALVGGLVGVPVLATQESGDGSVSLSLNQEQPPAEERLELVCKYPTYEGKSGDSFEFEVALKWLGSEARTFELAVTEPPPGWSVVIMGGYPEKKISAIGLEPGMTYPETIKVKLAPSLGEWPEPGDYVVTVEASSGNIKETIELNAAVVARYLFAFYTATGRLNTEVTAGKENHFSCYVQNTGSTAITNIDFMSAKPEGWKITFNPDSVDSLETGYAHEVDIVIEPPRKTVPGDYMITLKTIAKEVPVRDIELRVTVLTPTVWGWVGVLIVVAVIAGLAVMFRRLGRR